MTMTKLCYGIELVRLLNVVRYLLTVQIGMIYRKKGVSVRLV